MEFLSQNAEAIYAGIAMVVGFFWTMIKTSSWWKKRVRDNLTGDLESIGRLAGVVVMRTYRERIKDIKKPGEKLTDGQVDEIQEYAYQVFQSEGKKHAKELIKKYGEQFIRAKIENAYKVTKATGQQATSALAVPARIGTFKPNFEEKT